MRCVVLFIFLLGFLGCSSDDLVGTHGQNERSERFNINFTVGNKKFSDRALLIYPKRYDPKADNKLIIYCHSGGGFVSNNASEAESQDYVRYFSSLGYLILDVNGIPDEIVAEKKIDVGRSVGNILALNEYIEGYEYVVSRSNITSTYIFANSNGGLVAANLVNLTDIKFAAQAGICPLLSIKENAWFIDSGRVGTGQFSSLQNRSNIIRLYGMKDAFTQEELNSAKYDKDKVGKYDPFEYLKDNKIKYRTAYKIFQPKDDPKVYYRIAKQFTELATKYGGNVVLKTIETGGHNSEPQFSIVGSYTYKSVKYNLTPTVYEAAEWFEEYGGFKAQVY